MRVNPQQHHYATLNKISAPQALKRLTYLSKQNSLVPTLRPQHNKYKQKNWIKLVNEIS